MELNTLHMPPSEWNNGDDVTFKPYKRGLIIGFDCTTNGKTDLIYLAASYRECRIFIVQGQVGDLLNDEVIQHVATQNSAPIEPWTDGHAVGFKYTDPKGEARYLYLNPSGGGDSPDVFVYDGESGDPGQDSPLFFLAPEGTFPPPDSDDHDDELTSPGQ